MTTQTPAVSATTFGHASRSSVQQNRTVDQRISYRPPLATEAGASPPRLAAFRRRRYRTFLLPKIPIFDAAQLFPTTDQRRNHAFGRILGGLRECDWYSGPRNWP